ncbi:MAG: DUF3160 domain-containing protein [Bradymonadales bacterium]|nr:DUF3160 domain-containing protein [Bradymonadales bacterium]
MKVKRQNRWLAGSLICAGMLVYAGLAFSADRMEGESRSPLSLDLYPGESQGDWRLASLNTSDPATGRHVEQAAIALVGHESLAERSLAVAHVQDTRSSTRYLDRIQSALTFSDRERDLLAQNGFVIMDDQMMTFAQAYDTIYVRDLPVYISADMLQHAIHRSYDAILKRIETERLIPELRILLTDMRRRLQEGAIDVLGEQVKADADLYLAVALGLLSGGPVATVAGADQAFVRQLIDLAVAAGEPSFQDLFGSSRMVDFSQFEPRGHYTDSPELSRYFKSMMWLGRIDIRLIEVTLGIQIFNRRQFELAAGLDGLLDSEGRQRHQRISDVIATFVGQADSMRPSEFAALYADLEATKLLDLAMLADETIEEAIRAGGYGFQRIASHIAFTLPGLDTMPLPHSFLLFGQAYILDSEVLSNVVYDRIPNLRLMPSPLDVAFAALGNDQAASLLEHELSRWNYADQLNRMRDAVDALGPEFWESNLYNLWLNALRQLSPAAWSSSPHASSLPGVFTTDAWGRRLLNTQLASWAELRHDTLLYAKQSYTAAIGCSYPDVYVDPYPEYFRAVALYANAGHVQMDALGIRDLDGYFVRLGEIATTLAEMAERQLQGLPLLEEHRRFAESMVRIEDVGVCGTVLEAHGWYSDLFVAGADPLEFDPTIADVHTQPTDEMGNLVGHILHVGTGRPRLMTVIVDTPDGARAFVGAVSSYYEVTTANFDRLTDQRWASQLLDHTSPVPWMRDLMAE